MRLYFGVAAMAGVLMVMGLGTGCEKSAGPTAVPDEEVTPRVPAAEKQPEQAEDASAAAVGGQRSEPAAGPNPQGSGDVWCFPEYYRIDCVSGAMAETGFQPVSEEFKRRNEVYHAASNTVKLVGMKGETLPFQVMVEGGHSDVTMEFHGLPVEAYFYYEGYLQWWDKDTVRYSPDVAVPLEWLRGKFSVAEAPEPLPEIADKKMQAIWVDLVIPRDASPDKRTGSLRVTSAGKLLSEIGVEVEVIDAALPEQPAYINAMIHYGMCRKHPRMEMDAYRRMHAHRLSIHDIPYSSQRGWGYEGCIPKTTLSPAFEKYDEFRRKALNMTEEERAAYEYLPEIEKLRDPSIHTVRGENLEQRFRELMPLHDMILRECIRLYEENGAGVVDWSDFDRRYGPMFDGSAFKDGIPLVSFELPFNFNWPAPLDHFGIYEPQQSEMYEDIWVQVAQDFLEHANEKGWTRTKFFVYFNPKDRGNNLVMWKGDEPCERNDFLGHKYFNELFWKAFTDPGDVQVDHKIEVGHWECDAAVCRKRHYDSKTWDEDNAREMLKGFRVWVPNSRHYHSARHIAWNQMEEQGDIFYTYGGMATYDQTSMGLYGIAFQGFEDRTSGYFYYIPGMTGFKVWRDNPDAAIRDTKFARPDDNVAHYDASEFGRPDEFLMSLRLKALRGVEQHYAAFQAAEAKDAGWAGWLKKETVKYVVASGGPDRGSTIVVNNNNPRDLFTARLQALAIISEDASLSEERELEGPIKGVTAKTDTFHYCLNCGEACSPDRCEWCGALQKEEEPSPAEMPTDASTLILQQGKNAYSGCRDTFVEAGQSGADRDDRLELESDGAGRVLKGILVKFDLPADELSSTASVYRAVLVLQAKRQSRSGGSAEVWTAGGRWSERLGYPEAERLKDRRITTFRFEDYRTEGKTNIDPPKPVAIDVTSAVRAWVAEPASNYGLMLLPVKDDGTDVRFHAADVDKAEYRPRLEITYTP